MQDVNRPSLGTSMVLVTERLWMCGEVKNPNSRRTTSSFTRSHGMKENGTKGKRPHKKKSPNSSKALSSNPKEIS
jgi:hypothetical protein